MSKIDERFIKRLGHHALRNIQGGKVEGDQVTEAYHLTREEWEKLPIRPSVISPANGETNINQAPQIVGTPYAHPYDVGMYQKHIQIATTNDFAAPVYDKEEFSGTPVFQVLLKPDNSPYLTQDTTYYVRIRYQDRKGRWSHWSAPSMFKTMVQFPEGILLTPIMTAPPDGGEAPPINPVLAMSSPKVLAGTANFDKADWQISTDSTFATTLYDAQGTDDLTFHTTTGLNLATTLGVDFFARGRQRTTNGVYTPWAVPVRFGVRPEYSDPVFGMRRIFSKKCKHPLVYNIDLDGEQVFISKRYWGRHPLYQFAQQDVAVGQNDAGVNVISEMVFLPPAWIKYAVYDNADGEMVIDEWFSATQKTGDGWMLHPAFAPSSNGLLLGKRVAGTVTIGGKAVLVCNEAPPTFSPNESHIANLRSLDRTWHGYSVYERWLLNDLIMAEYITTDMETVWRQNQSGWRGLEFPLQAKDKTSGVYVWGWDPIRAPSNMYIGVALQHPQMNGNISSIAVSLSEGYKYCVTEVCRGYNPFMGFDIAMLMMPKATEGNADGAMKCPFGWADQMNIFSTTAVNGMGSCVAPSRTGLTGIAPFGENSYRYGVIAKWLA